MTRTLPVKREQGVLCWLAVEGRIFWEEHFKSPFLGTPLSQEETCLWATVECSLLLLQYIIKRKKKGGGQWSILEQSHCPTSPPPTPVLPHRFLAQLLILQRWSCLFGYANLLPSRWTHPCCSEQRTWASNGKLAMACLFISSLQTRLPLWMSWQHFLGSSPSSVPSPQTFCQSRSQKFYKKYHMGKQFKVCLVPVCSL